MVVQAIAGSFNPDGSRGTAIAGCSKDEVELQVLRSNRQWWQMPRRNFLYLKVLAMGLLWACYGLAIGLL